MVLENWYYFLSFMLYYAVVFWQMKATKGWNRGKVVIEHATKRLG